MDSQTVPALDADDQSVGTVKTTLMHVALLVEIVVHPVATMHTHGLFLLTLRFSAKYNSAIDRHGPTALRF